MKVSGKIPFLHKDIFIFIVIMAEWFILLFTMLFLLNGSPEIIRMAFFNIFYQSVGVFPITELEYITTTDTQ